MYSVCVFIYMLGFFALSNYQVSGHWVATFPQAVERRVEVSLCSGHLLHAALLCPSNPCVSFWLRSMSVNNCLIL